MVPALMQKVKVELAAASQSAAATRSANIDTLGYDYAVIAVSLGAEVNTSAATVAVVIKEADDTGAATNFATWASTFSRGEDQTTVHGGLFHIDLRPRKRFLQVSITNGTHTTNDLVTSCAYSMLSRAEESLPGTAALAGSTNDYVVVG